MTMEVNQVYQMDALELLMSLDPQSVDCICTDLPYGTTSCAWDEIIPFAPMWAAVKHALKPRGAFVTTASQPFTSALVMSNPKWFRYEWVWQKTVFSNPHLVKYQPAKLHENVVVFTPQSLSYFPQMEFGEPYTDVIRASGLKKAIKLPIANEGTRYPSSVQKFANPNNDSKHPTAKPQDLFEYLIRTYTQPNDLVVDMCCGSGTTAAACIATGRHYIVGDSDPHYCEVTRLRLQHTSKQELAAALQGKPTTKPMFTD